MTQQSQGLNTIFAGRAINRKSESLTLHAGNLTLSTRRPLFAEFWDVNKSIFKLMLRNSQFHSETKKFLNIKKKVHRYFKRLINISRRFFCSIIITVLIRSQAKTKTPLNFSSTHLSYPEKVINRSVDKGNMWCV